VRERAALTGAVLAFFLAGYFGIGWLDDPSRARSLALPLDGRIPFVLGSVIVYWSVLALALLPIFCVRNAALFRRVALAYALATAASFACFLVLPVTSIGFRPDANVYADAGFAGWLLRLLHFLDPPLNLFPSLHLALATLAALAALRVWPALGAFALVWTACILVAVCTTKQHYALDALAGLALAGAAHAAVVARAPRAGTRAASFGARGAACFAVLVALFYAGLYGSYLVGLAPWTWWIG
jgi:hypothetical protein